MTPPLEGAPAPPVPSLSTMWAVQPRYERDLHAFLERTAELGYGGIEINHSMDAAQVGAILAYAGRGDAVRVTGVHAPAPLEKDRTYGWNRAMNLASTDEGHREAAVRHHLRSIDLAAEAGASIVVVHLGGISERPMTGERRLRSLYERRDQMNQEWDRVVDETVRERALAAPPHLEAARRSLETLTRCAEERGVTIGLECRLHYHEIPLPQEARDLLEGLPPTAAGYLHDVGHAEVLHRLGLVDRSAWWDLLGDRLAGLHLHDVRGLTDHRAPGNGDVDYAWLAKRLDPSAARTFEIDQHEPDEDVARGLRLLRTAGIVAE